MCTVEDLNVATYNEDDPVMGDRLYSMGGDEVDDNYENISESYSHSSSIINLINYAFPQCDLQRRTESLMSRSGGGIPKSWILLDS